MTVDEYTDTQGVKWISPGRAAEIWNERAKELGIEAHYTRQSVRARRGKLGGIETPLGFLYSEEKVRSIKLRPRSKRRPDVTAKNISRTRVTSDKEPTAEQVTNPVHEN